MLKKRIVTQIKINNKMQAYKKVQVCNKIVKII